MMVCDEFRLMLLCVAEISNKAMLVNEPICTRNQYVSISLYQHSMVGTILRIILWRRKTKKKELDFTNLTNWFYSMYLRINCILKKQRCLCNSKIKFQIPPLAGKNLIELFSWNADAGEMREFNHMTFILKWTLHEPNKYRLYASFCHKKGTC